MTRDIEKNVEEFERWKLAQDITQQIERNLTKKYAWIGALSALIISVVLTTLVQSYTTQALADAHVQLEVSKALLDESKKELDELRAKSTLVDELELKVLELNKLGENASATLKIINTDFLSNKSSISNRENVWKQYEAKFHVSSDVTKGHALVCSGSELYSKELIVRSIGGSNLISINATVDKACEASDKEQVWVNSEDARSLGLSDGWGWNIVNVSVRNAN
ncbi:hypothetical protein NTE10_000419 [Vibrio harveyi]|nr:hypothetical protein [Vibrio harveyi]